MLIQINVAMKKNSLSCDINYSKLKETIVHRTKFSDSVIKMNDDI